MKRNCGRKAYLVIQLHSSYWIPLFFIMVFTLLCAVAESIDNYDYILARYSW